MLPIAKVSGPGSSYPIGSKIDTTVSEQRPDTGRDRAVNDTVQLYLRNGVRRSVT